MAASSTTDDATMALNAGAGPVTVNVAVVTVAGFILAPEGTLKVALTLVLGHAVADPAIGFVDSTETFVATPGGGGGGTQLAMVKFHTKLPDIWLAGTARSLTPFVPPTMVAV